MLRSKEQFLTRKGIPFREQLFNSHRWPRAQSGMP